MSADTAAIEAKLAGFVRSYLEALGQGDLTEQQEHHLCICSTLEWLLQTLLRSTEEWELHWWVDGLTSASTTVVSSVEVEVRGLIVWVEGQKAYWVDPFFGSARISRTDDTLVYRIAFGDAAWGVGHVSYGGRLKRGWPDAKEWLFVFSQGTLIESDRAIDGLPPQREET